MEIIDPFFSAEEAQIALSLRPFPEPVSAIEIEKDLATVRRSKWMGCGLWGSACPNESIAMILKQPDDTAHIYANDFGLLQARAEDTNRPYPFESHRKQND